MKIIGVINKNVSLFLSEIPLDKLAWDNTRFSKSKMS